MLSETAIPAAGLSCSEHAAERAETKAHHCKARVPAGRQPLPAMLLGMPEQSSATPSPSCHLAAARPLQAAAQCELLTAELHTLLQSASVHTWPINAPEGASRGAVLHVATPAQVIVAERQARETRATDGELVAAIALHALVHCWPCAGGGCLPAGACSSQPSIVCSSQPAAASMRSLTSCAEKLVQQHTGSAHPESPPAAQRCQSSGRELLPRRRPPTFLCPPAAEALESGTVWGMCCAS